MPAGIVTRSVLRRSVRPSPWHVSHGSVISLPSPWHLRARGDVHHLAEHRPTRRADLAPAAALLAGDRLGAGLGAAAGARLAASEDRELDLLVDALDGFLEGDPEVVAKVGSGQRMAAPRPRLRPTEERVEDVAEAAEAATEVAGFGAIADGSEHVVGLAPLRVGQDLVGLVDLLEPEIRARYPG